MQNLVRAMLGAGDRTKARQKATCDDLPRDMVSRYRTDWNTS